MSRLLTDPTSYLATMHAIAVDPNCATQDSFELADCGRAFERHTGPVRDASGELIGRIIVLREITAEREAERLKAEAERLTAEIATERDTAQLKSELVATVSHELRTPLTSVLGFAELMLHQDLDDDTRRRYLQTIHSEAQRLTRLIDDFLDLEKIEAGRFTIALEPFDLSEVVQHQMELAAMPSANHHLEFSPGGPLAIVGDQTRMGQVMSNLLSNAIKYSPAGGTVTITATPQDGFARVCVADQGLGIPADQQAAVFTKFFRADSSDTRRSVARVWDSRSARKSSKPTAAGSASRARRARAARSGSKSLPLCPPLRPQLCPPVTPIPARGSSSSRTTWRSLRWLPSTSHSKTSRSKASRPANWASSEHWRSHPQ